MFKKIFLNTLVLFFIIYPHMGHTQGNPYEDVGVLHNKILDGLSIYKTKLVDQPYKVQKEKLSQLVSNNFCSDNNKISNSFKSKNNCLAISEKIAQVTLDDWASYKFSDKETLIKIISQSAILNRLDSSERDLLLEVYMSLAESLEEVPTSLITLSIIEEKALSLNLDSPELFSAIAVAKHTTAYWAEQLSLGDKSNWVTTTANRGFWRSLLNVLAADVVGACAGAAVGGVVGGVVGAAVTSGYQATQETW